ncbi:serine/threonine-protein kinase 19-like isoform X3 [Sinocyclocheilus grahami]|uniref:serine/threonine-protein kinase 19-like isoform X3 n=1 Tax=Sinocyclocheilus grahami TaxID=75366 RepID=UPI0007AD4AF0|nr:PREDICTED: serine/threonine-protein kinase 19-like isoform X3 [Sinocyclocheilus grahami]
MSRKRALIADTFCLTKRRRCAADSVTADGAADIRSSLQYLMTLFSRKLFNDSLPPVVLKHQLYSLHNDKTSVDKQVNELRENGDLLMFQLGFDSEAFALVFAEDYRTKVLQGEAGRETLGTVEKFLAKLIPGCSDLSFNKEKMLKEFLFTDPAITQLVKSGVLTVRDAGSWWLSIPNSGKFIKYFIKGRKAVLGMVKKSKYGEILKTELEGHHTTSQHTDNIRNIITIRGRKRQLRAPLT